jgi:TRAP-type uncharacterized transport system substrate-binding protein
MNKLFLLLVFLSAECMGANSSFSSSRSSPSPSRSTPSFSIRAPTPSVKVNPSFSSNPSKSAFAAKTSSSFNVRAPTPSVKASSSFSASAAKPATPTIKIGQTSQPVKASSFSQAKTSKDYNQVYQQYKQSFNKPTFSYKDYRRNQSVPRTDRLKSYYGDYRPRYYTPQYQGGVQRVEISHSYGNYDGLLMWSILDEAGDALMMYNHQNDPAFQDWRREANKLAENNQEVKDKLDKLDRKLADMDKAKLPKDPDYITPGIDPSIYEAEIDKSKIPVIKFCASGISGDYYAIGFAINQKTKINVEMIQTNGSEDNLKRVNSGECQLGLSQSDLFNKQKKEYLNVSLIGDVKKEPGILICNKTVAANDISELHNNKVYVGKDQTGSIFTLSYLKTALNSKFEIVQTQSMLESLEWVKLYSGSCAFSVTSPDNKAIKSASNKQNLKIATLDLALKDKSDYILVDIATRRYPSSFSRNGLVPTIAVSTDLVVNNQWKTNNTTTYDLLLMEMDNIRSLIND